MTWRWGGLGARHPRLPGQGNVRADGADRILFASDYPLLRASRVIAQVRETLDAPTADAVLGGNAARLLGLYDEETRGR